MKVKTFPTYSRVLTFRSLISKSEADREPLADISHMYAEEQEDKSPTEEDIQKIRKMLSEPSTNYPPPDLTPILKYYLNSEYPPKAFLLAHLITPTHRIKMLDWMVEIFDAYQTNFSSFYFAIAILDAYFYKTKKSLQYQELHLIGVVSIFISSKFNDRASLTLEQINEVCKGTFTSVIIQDFEIELLSTIQFNVNQKHAYLFLKLYLGMITERIELEKGPELFEISAYLLKLVLFDYQIVSTFKQSEIAAAVLLCISFLFAKKYQDFPIQEIIDLLKSLDISVKDVNEVGQACETVMRNYKHRYPQVKNVYKYNEYADQQLGKLLRN